MTKSEVLKLVEMINDAAMDEMRKYKEVCDKESASDRLQAITTWHAARMLDGVYNQCIGWIKAAEKDGAFN